MAAGALRAVGAQTTIVKLVVVQFNRPAGQAEESGAGRSESFKKGRLISRRAAEVFGGQGGATARDSGFLAGQDKHRSYLIRIGSMAPHPGAEFGVV